MDLLLQGLRAASEVTRLRILGLCAHAELTVSELVEILGQSQPRLSRHLRPLFEAGLIERYQEGNWAYYRLNEAAGSGGLAAETPVRVETGPLAAILWSGRQPANDAQAPDPALEVG